MAPILAGGGESRDAGRLPPETESWDSNDAVLAEHGASGAYRDSLETRWSTETRLASYLLATGDRGGGEPPPWNLSPTRKLLAVAMQCMAFVGCAKTNHPWDAPDPFPLKPQSMLCGQPLPDDCQYRNRSFSELPSGLPATEMAEDPAGGVAPERRQSLQVWIVDSTRFELREPFAILGIARGTYGDSVDTRRNWERQLAQRLAFGGDDGGAADLLALWMKEGEREWGAHELGLLFRVVRRCPSAKLLSALTLVPEEDLYPGFDTPAEGWTAAAVLNLYKARGFVEIGAYTESVTLFERYEREVPYRMDFVVQCKEWLKGRAEESTTVPVGRPCNCEIEPPKWREGCGCYPASESIEVPGSSREPDPDQPVCEPDGPEEPGGVINVDKPCREGP